MDKFKAPRDLEEFKARSKDANKRSIPIVISALERQKQNLTRPLDMEIKFHRQMLAYLEDGEVPEEFV